MEFIERLGLLAMAVTGCFFFVFMLWRLVIARKTCGEMSRGRIVWLLLGGLSIIAVVALMALGVWLNGPPARVRNSNVEAFTGVAMFLAGFGWGASEIAIALRAAFARKRA